MDRHRPAGARGRPGHARRRTHPRGPRRRVRDDAQGRPQPGDGGRPPGGGADRHRAAPGHPRHPGDRRGRSGCRAGARPERHLLAGRPRWTVHGSSPPAATSSPSISAWCITAPPCWAWWVCRRSASCSAASSAAAPGSAPGRASSRSPPGSPPPEGLTVLASRHYANDARLERLSGRAPRRRDHQLRLGAEDRAGGGGGRRPLPRALAAPWSGIPRGHRRCWRRPAGDLTGPVGRRAQLRQAGLGEPALHLSAAPIPSARDAPLAAG